MKDIINATEYFQAVTGKILGGDGWAMLSGLGRGCSDLGAGWSHFGGTHRGCLEHLIARGLYAATHKAVSHQPDVTWCGCVYSGTATVLDPERTQGSLDLRRPSTGGELMHILKAVN